MKIKIDYPFMGYKEWQVDKLDIEDDGMKVKYYIYPKGMKRDKEDFHVIYSVKPFSNDMLVEFILTGLVQDKVTYTINED